MELLDALEQKVTELLSDIAVLRAKNSQLEKLIAANATNDYAGGDLQLENRYKSLEKKLETEKRARQTVLAGIDCLIKRLEENSNAGQSHAKL